MYTTSESSHITRLAQSIVANTTIVNTYLSEQNLPLPDFDDINATIRPCTADDPSAELARQAVVTAAQELRDLLSGPSAPLMVDWTAHSCLRTIMHFKLAEAISLVPTNGIGTSFASIAAQTPLSEDHVARILRHAMTRHIFREPMPGFVAHTAASALLTRDSVTQDVVGLLTDELWPAGFKAAEALARWPGSQEPEETGYSMANAQGPREQGKSMWSVFEEDAERARRFGVSMSVEDSEMPFPLEELEWQGLVVDVGGGVGFNAFSLAEKYQNTKFIVEDLPKTVQQGRLLLPEQLKDRVDFVEHNFFSPQPVKDADIYFFRRIFHDWSDRHAVKILQSLIPALKPGARVRVNELLLPKAGELPREIEKLARNSDFAMLALLNGKERSKEQWQALFRSASEKFQFHSCKTTPPGLMAVIEFVWEP